jgi:hypothetical protein
MANMGGPANIVFTIVLEKNVMRWLRGGKGF